MIRNSQFVIRDSLRGFTLIEALTVLFILAVVVLTFYETWNLGTKYIINTKSRFGATALANQKMEIIHNLQYDFIGTTDGIPTGSVIEDETVAVNTVTYQVHTFIEFVDDPQDGTLALGTDLVPNDYKRIRITVSWGGGGPAEQVSLVDIISQDGVESAAAGTGSLSINALDGAGNPVPSVSAHIVNSTISPSVDLNTVSDSAGNITLPGAKESGAAYQITLSKSGYYGNHTYAAYPTTSFNPVNVHASIVAGSLTQTTLVIDQQSTLQIRSKNPFDQAVASIPFSIDGGLLIGHDATTLAPVYSLSQTTTTDGSGAKDFANESPGTYTISDPSTAQYRFLRFSPIGPTKSTISLAPGVTQTVSMILAQKSFSSALVVVKSSVDSSLLPGASVELHSVSLGYDETVVTDAYGQAYFPTSATPLVAGTYDIDTTLTNYAVAHDTVVITGTDLVNKDVTLSPE
jgi:prepilin-type N-terminal cleavage/methylation domain-containing protein